MNDTTPLSPGAPDEAAVKSMFERHQADLASLNPDDPASPVYQRPDLAQQWRERFQAEFDTIVACHGIAPPRAKTPEEIAEERFDAGWRPMPISEAFTADLEAELDRIDGLSQGERDSMVAELKKAHGEEGYAHLLTEAQAGLNGTEPLTPSMKASKHFLTLLAAYGRRVHAHDRSRVAFDTALAARRGAK